MEEAQIKNSKTDPNLTVVSGVQLSSEQPSDSRFVYDLTRTVTDRTAVVDQEKGNICDQEDLSKDD